MEQQPLVSVIIPTYSRPDNIVRAINSVLAQTYKNIEIIVVDDNGEGTPHQIETEKVLREYIDNDKITYIKHEVNKNGSAARNTGFRLSCGEYINFLDDDDVFAPTKIEKQVARLEKDEKFDACYCNSLIQGRHRKIITHNLKEGDLTLEVLTGKNNFNTSTILFKRKALFNIGGWDESFRRHQDWELMIRFFRKHKICIAEPKKQLLTKFDTYNIVYKNPFKSVEYREHFLTKMEEDILRTQNKTAILRWQMEDLSLNLMSHGGKELGRKYFLKIFNYGLPSMSALLKLVYYMIAK